MGITPVSAYSTNAVLYKYGSDRDVAAPAKTDKSDLSPDDQRKVDELQRRDQDVRTHEAAHQAAGGQYVRGGATFQYQQGPDGKMYAVGGEVSIDTSSVKDDPQATIAKMETVQRAALAPADPSGQDRSVASAASVEEAQARQELAKKNAAALTKGSPDGQAAAAGRSTQPPSRTYNQKGLSASFASTAPAAFLVIA